MKQYSALNWLVAIIVLCALAATGFGLFTPNTGSLISFRTVRDEAVEIWGQGLYKYDTPIGATGFTAADVITLVLAIPVLLISINMYRRGSLKGGLLLTGVLAYFLYNYTSMGFGTAYNNLFLAYILIFSASLFGLILALLSFDLKTLPSHFRTGLPCLPAQHGRNGVHQACEHDQYCCRPGNLVKVFPVGIVQFDL